MSTRSWLSKLFTRKARPLVALAGTGRNRRVKNHTRLKIEELEERLTPASTPGRELVIIDAAVPDKALLQSVAPGTEVDVLQANQDGVGQLAALLAGRSGFDAISIVSHGSAGALKLGDTLLTDANLGTYAPELAMLRSALAPGGDLLLYGCSVAAGSTGQAFATDLARLTGKDVAASTHLVGAADRGGNWNLDWHSGPITAPAPFSPAALAAYPDTLDIAITAVPGQGTAITQPDPLFPNAGLNPVPTQGVVQVYDSSSNTWVTLNKGDVIHFRTEQVQYLANANASGTDTFTLAQFTYDVTISQPSAPTITTQPQDTTATYFANTLQDQGVTLTVAATGIPTPTYQWYQGASGDTSNPISGATAASYHTPGLTQTTLYWVQVSNANGTADSRTVTVSVSQQPVIVFQPDQPIRPVHYGQSAPLGVYAVGGVPLQYQWFQGQSGDTSNPVSPLQDSSNFDSAPLNGPTTFWVRVSNAFGSVDSQAVTVTPLDTPVVTAPLANPEVEPGGSVTLSVSAGGKPTLTYQWYEGQSGDTSHPIAGATDSTFQTGPLSTSTDYWVRVSNASGTADSTTASVAVIPVYTVVNGGALPGTSNALVPIPANRVVIPDPFGLRGTNRVFTFPANGWIVFGPATTTDRLALTLDGPSLLGATNDALAQTLQAGYFTYGPAVGTTATSDEFTISDEGNGYPDTITRTIRINILYAPSITSQSADSTTWSGQPATISVTASGNEPPTYQLYQGESGDTSHPVGSPQSTGTFTPVLTTTAVAQTMRFWVRASNSLGTADSQAVSVVVQGAPAVTTQPQSETIFAGQTPSLSVTATGNGLTYQWYEGQPGDTSQPVNGATSANLTTPALQTTRNFWVLVSNPAGSVDSAAATVTVNPPPVITTEPQDVAIFAGQNTTLSATAAGAGLSYQWYLGTSGDTSNPIGGATSATYTTPTLNATATYWLLVTNAAGTADSRTDTVTVNGPPVIVTQPADTSVGKGQTATLTATASGVGLSYQWYTGASGDTSNPVSGATSATLTTGPLTAAATFWLQVTNPAGPTDTAAARVTLAPTITWSSPADVTYGTALGSTQLDATADVPGTFRYTLADGITPAAGAILHAGLNQTLRVSFTPTDATDFTSASGSTTINVDPAMLTVTADDATRSYGVANPGFTATITGFVHGDTLATSGVTGSPSLSTAATTASPPGSYVITAGAGSLASSNYAFTFGNGTLTVTAAPLSATGVNFLAPAGGPYGGPVATFANPDPFASAASYTATITWGDGSSSAGLISDNGDGTFSVSGTHTYTDPGSYAVAVQLSHNLGFTTPAMTGSTATVVSLGLPVQRGMVAGPAFWGGQGGQALILAFDGGPASTTLAGWLAATLPNLFGTAAGAFDLAGMSNAEVAVFYQWLRHQRGRKLEAEVLALALSLYATTPTLGGAVGGLCGFNASGLGLGPLWVGVGRSGRAFGVANHSRLSVWQLLQRIDGRARLGTAYPGSHALQHQAEKVLGALL
jgi:hypothetical protein